MLLIISLTETQPCSLRHLTLFTSKEEVKLAYIFCANKRFTICLSQVFFSCFYGYVAMIFDQGFEKLDSEQQKMVVDELKRLARFYLSKERADHTLQTTELVNEAYANLAGKSIYLQNKQHFVAITARQMRRVLVDHARKKMASKRDLIPVTITMSQLYEEDDTGKNAIELIHIDKLLTDLGRVDPRSSKIMELKLFSSLRNNEIAEVIGVSAATAERDIKAAKAWLRTELSAC